MISLRTTYLGLDLASPIVASPSPLTGDRAKVQRLAEAGVGAVVLPSLFEEEVLHEELELAGAIDGAAEFNAEATTYFPPLHSFRSTADLYLDGLEATASAVDVPVIASLNVTAGGRWTSYARLLENAGAAAVELNLYRVAADPGRSAADVEAEDLALIEAVRGELGVPLAVKLSPYYSALAHFAAGVRDAGAAGLVLFNRFYQPDIDLELLDVTPHLQLSERVELRLPLRWIAILRSQLGDAFGLAATSGVHSGTDVAKALLVGADVAMTTSALLQHGPEYVRTMTYSLLTWMQGHGYTSVDELRGAMRQDRAADPSAFERANYVKTLHSWS
jgi:dihydroorotate dehydrogenase (fumarate)